MPVTHVTINAAINNRAGGSEWFSDVVYSQHKKQPLRQNTVWNVTFHRFVHLICVHRLNYSSTAPRTSWRRFLFTRLLTHNIKYDECYFPKKKKKSYDLVLQLYSSWMDETYRRALFTNVDVKRTQRKNLTPRIATYNEEKARFHPDGQTARKRLSVSALN